MRESTARMRFVLTFCSIGFLTAFFTPAMSFHAPSGLVYPQNTMPATTYSVVAAKNHARSGLFFAEKRISSRIFSIRHWLYISSLLYRTFANRSSVFHTAIGWYACAALSPNF
jgi:hypothetical protein